jgi:hypothetical protein
MAAQAISGEIGNAAKDVGILDDDAAGFAIDRGDHACGVRLCRAKAGAASITSPVNLAMVFAARHSAGAARPTARLARLVTRAAMLIASQQAVEPSYIEALAIIGSEQPRDLGLEFEQHLQRALRDFRLIGRVGGQELAALDQVIDAGRDMVAIGPCPQEERH